MFVPAVTSAVTAAGYVPTAQPAAPSGPSGTDAAFGASFASSVDGLQSMQATTDALAVKAVTGDLADVHQYTIAATESAVAMELTATVRNRAIEAFNEIMRMQG
jgi:flagellar hook-basal body complex protein FliE